MTGSLARQRETLALATRAQVDNLALSTVDPNWNEYDLEALVGHDRAMNGSGRSLQAEVDAALLGWVSADRSSGTGIESFDAYRRRCAQALESACALAGPGRVVLVVSSSGTISQVLAQIMNLETETWIRLSRTMINGSISKLIVGSSGVSAVSWNEHAHLDTRVARSHTLMTFR